MFHVCTYLLLITVSPTLIMEMYIDMAQSMSKNEVLLDTTGCFQVQTERFPPHLPLFLMVFKCYSTMDNVTAGGESYHTHMKELSLMLCV